MGSPALLQTVTAARSWRAMRQRAGASVALVPTLGNLHAGHGALIDAARRTADFVIVSVFVNPTQFGPGEDYAAYPRTLAEDRTLAGEHEADAVFAPGVAEMYPHGPETPVQVLAPAALTDILCGARRPGHFAGVAGVVTRLLNIVQPEYVLFGEKDYQQLLVVRRVVRELFLDTGIVGVPTVRETDGLALSSRNRYLTPEERERAPRLYRALATAAEALRAGSSADSVERAGAAELDTAGFKTEYFAVRDAVSLGAPEPDRDRIVFAAAWLGKARLIDNMHVD
ncbi:MAG: pantoate--beta-alanine ligase [Gammaproteobacteria bacterium]